MKKFTVLALALLVLSLGVAPQSTAKVPAIVAPVVATAPAHSDMLNALRPLLKSLKSDDSALVREGFAACASLLFRDKDKYRESVLAEYPDMELALDHLMVAAAAKQYLCP